MRLSKILPALLVAAILAPLPAAASGLTPIDQQRPVRQNGEQLRQRLADRRAAMAERRQTAQKRQAEVRAKRDKSVGAERQRKLTTDRMYKQLEHRLRAMKQRLARRHVVRRRF